MSVTEAGKAFLAGVLAKLPEHLRAQAEAVWAVPEATDALNAMGEGALARSDYSRNMDELRTKRDELDAIHQEQLAWWERSRGTVEEYQRLKPELERLKSGGNGGDKPVFDEESLARTLEQRDRSYAAAMALVQKISLQHFRDFQEVLDTDELINDPRLGQPLKGQSGRSFGLQDAYLAKYGDRVSLRAKEAREAEINKLVQDRLAEELAKRPMSQPFPLRSAEPSPLDALTTEKGPAQHTLDSAVAEYDRLQQVRQG